MTDFRFRRATLGASLKKIQNSNVFAGDTVETAIYLLMSGFVGGIATFLMYIGSISLLLLLIAILALIFVVPNAEIEF